MRSAHMPRRRFGVLAATVVATASMLVTTAVPGVWAADKDELSQKIKDAQAEYNQASAAAKKAAAALQSVKTKLPAAQAKLAAANKKLAASRAADRAAAAALAAAIAEDRRIQGEIIAMENKIKDMEGKVSNLARRLYTQGGTFVELEIVLESKDPSEFTERLAAVNAVARSSNASLLDMANAKADLAVAKVKAEKQREIVNTKRQEAKSLLAAADAAQEEAAQAKKVVDNLVAQRASALKVAEGEKAKALRELNELKAEQRALLAKAKKGANVFAGPGPSGLYWPIPNASTSGQIGWRRHPVYGYRSCHTGVDLRAGYGTPIRAAADGIVIDVASGGAYGRRTLISHGGGMTTMYAHQSRISVTEGERVDKGQVIGYVGSTGYSTGPHLHFEVHINGVPRNPLGWFGGSKSIISCWDQV